MDTDLRKGTEDGEAGAARQKDSEEVCRKQAEQDGKGTPPRCPDDYCFEVGM